MRKQAIKHIVSDLKQRTNCKNWYQLKRFCNLYTQVKNLFN